MHDQGKQQVSEAANINEKYQSCAQSIGLIWHLQFCHKSQSSAELQLKLTVGTSKSKQPRKQLCFLDLAVLSEIT